MKPAQPYQGYELGPIRPPSEAASLCLRITRNCHWNRCTFCPVYKDMPFSLRPVDDVLQDIDIIFGHIATLETLAADTGQVATVAIRRIHQQLPPTDRTGFQAALNWYAGGMESVFLQDANSLVIKPANLLRILEHLRKRFPDIRRITSYARSKTVAKIADADLQALRAAGLNRLHIGFESGSDRVLKRVNKGVTKDQQILAGTKVKAAGMELSEYYMPGLGGQDGSEDHALESADALNRIDPDFIRLRSLTIPPQAALHEEYVAGRFRKCTDLMMVTEILQFIEHLDGITGTVVSDHFLNLLPQVAGRLPDDKAAMLQVLRDFLAADPETRLLYQVGKRAGLVHRLEQIHEPHTSMQVRLLCKQLGVTPDNVDALADELLIQHGL